jgi:hypothetical protein
MADNLRMDPFTTFYADTIAPTSGNITVTGPLDMQKNVLYVDTIMGSTSTTSLAMASPLKMGNNALSVATIQPTLTSISITGPVSMGSNALTVSTLQPTSTSISINGPVSMGSNTLSVSQIQPSGNLTLSGSLIMGTNTIYATTIQSIGASISIPNLVNMGSNTLTLGGLNSVSGTITSFSHLSLGSNTLTAGTIQAPSGSISVASPVNMGSNILSTAGGIKTDSIATTAGGNIQVTSPINFGSNSVFMTQISHPDGISGVISVTGNVALPRISNSGNSVSFLDNIDATAKSARFGTITLDGSFILDSLSAANVRGGQSLSCTTCAAPAGGGTVTIPYRYERVGKLVILSLGSTTWSHNGAIPQFTLPSTIWTPGDTTNQLEQHITVINSASGTALGLGIIGNGLLTIYQITAINAATGAPTYGTCATTVFCGIRQITLVYMVG